MTAGHFFALSLLAGACPSKKASSTVAFLLSILLAYSVVPSQIHHVTAAKELVTATIIRPDPSTWARTRCGNPGGDDTADIPSRWASVVDPAIHETPLPFYPRPQMVRLKKRCDHDDGVDNDNDDKFSKPKKNFKEPLFVGGVGTTESLLRRLRDTGDESTWVNLNGLWEWEQADMTSSGSSAGNSTSCNTPPYYHPPPDHPPFGRSLNSSILVPFPVEYGVKDGDAKAEEGWAEGRRRLGGRRRKVGQKAEEGWGRKASSDFASANFGVTRRALHDV